MYDHEEAVREHILEEQRRQVEHEERVREHEVLAREFTSRSNTRHITYWHSLRTFSALLLSTILKMLRKRAATTDEWVEADAEEVGGRTYSEETTIIS